MWWLSCLFKGYAYLKDVCKYRHKCMYVYVARGGDEKEGGGANNGIEGGRKGGIIII